MSAHTDRCNEETTGTEEFSTIKKTLQKLNLHTVCQEASCPNLGECWRTGSLTFMILGDACTRACNFCAVKSKPLKAPDPKEPLRLAKAVEEIGINYVVLTSVTRDDLPDQGSEQYAQCIRMVKEKNPNVVVEALIPDFQAQPNPLKRVVEAEPDVIGHNVETVRRLQKKVRDPRAGYDRSLSVLEQVKTLNSDIYTKSSLMLGLGETEEEVLQTMDDLREVQVDILTLGQYLQPAKELLEVKKYISPEEFEHYKEKARAKGFLYAATGPLVRSSYKSAEFFIRNVLEKEKVI